MKNIIIDGHSLTLEEVVAVSRHNVKVALSEEAVAKIQTSRKLVEDFVENEKVVYGITTGFGKFSDVFIEKEQSKKLQENLIMSHSCGVGQPLKTEYVRAAMLLRANALAKGNSGIRLETIEFLLKMLNENIHPIIPEKGSLGASGDLAPLSHMVLTLLGKGQAEYKGLVRDSADIFSELGIQPIELTSKEGLALINGTQIMTGIGSIVTYDAIQLMKMADLIGAMTMEALNGITDAYDPRVHEVRGQRGQIQAASNLRAILEGSKMTTKQGEMRVQDAYVLRCMPQIHGASRDAVRYVQDKVEIEINAVTDNPVIFPETGDVISGGNFHGQPMALAFDFLGIALSEYANCSERRLERLVNPSLSNGLPAFLVKNGGVNSGFMIVQYSAASLVSENKVLAHPASVDSIPSSANQEDHVSMGTIAARKARDILFNAQNVLAMEWMSACQAIDLRGNMGLGKGTEVLYQVARENTRTIEEDLIMYEEINKFYKLILDESILKRVEEVVGELY